MQSSILANLSVTSNSGGIAEPNLKDRVSSYEVA
jgi:hypothetical protein